LVFGSKGEFQRTEKEGGGIRPIKNLNLRKTGDRAGPPKLRPRKPMVGEKWGREIMGGKKGSSSGTTFEEWGASKKKMGGKIQKQ